VTNTISDAEVCRMIDAVWANDALCHAADWAELDRRLAAADVDGIPPAVMLTWLMMASRAFDEGHLSEWVPFLCRVNGEYAARGHTVGLMLKTYRAMAAAGPQRKVTP